VWLGLPVFSSDALSSVAYATEEILLVLLLAGSTYTNALHYSWNISIGIAVLLAIVAMSYRQTIHAYPGGGGSYIVARENLGTYPGLIAAAALLIDYVLTVAVSTAAGVAAVTSAVPTLADYRIYLCLGCILFVALANLRGAKESGMLFAIPTYSFVFSFLIMIGYGLFKIWFLGGAGISAVHPEHTPPPPILPAVTLSLILRAFSSGCTALTGVEAVSNGVPAFKPPESKNASTTLTLMATILITVFVGLTYLANKLHIVPDVTLHPGTLQFEPHETVVSMIARSIFDKSWFYYVIQAATAMILILAANTSFADFPRLSQLLAKDRFIPRQFANIGDRLVFANGIVLLWLLSSVLIAHFEGQTHALIPLYAVGVFLSFTLSQSGMIRHWLSLRTPGWWRSMIINGIGACTTGVVTLVIAYTKFQYGAWIVVVLIPLLVGMFLKINHHYRDLASQLTLKGASHPGPIRHTVLILVAGIHRGVLPALQYAKTIAADCRAIHIEIDPQESERFIKQWEEWGMGIPLVILESPYRSLIDPLFRYLDEVQGEREDHMVTVILPEFVSGRWWHHFLHNQAALLLKIALQFKKGITVTNIRYYPQAAKAQTEESQAFDRLGFHRMRSRQ